MLPRILEPEVMESEQDALEYDHMDHHQVNEAFTTETLALAPAVGTVVDLGTGTALIPILIAQRAPGLHLVAVDLSAEMLKLAAQHLAATGLADRIELVLADAKATGLPARHYDVVISNSIVHHVPEPLTIFREVQRLAKPDAPLFLRDLCRPPDLAYLARIVDTYAAGCSDYQRKLYRDSLHASLTVAEVQELARAAGLTGVRVYASSDRHWTLLRAPRAG